MTQRSAAPSAAAWTDRRPRARRPGALLGIVALIAAAAVVGCGSAPSTPPPSAALPTPTAASPSPVASVPSSAPASSSPLPTPTGAVEPADLTGVLVDPALAHRLPLAVMLDDNRVARPQAGFNAASLVYQAPADGFETRYMLVFQEGDTADIGPVRSARFYLVQWAQEVKAALAHYGGDRRTRSYIKWHPKQFTDVDGMTRGNPAYHRIKSRKAPHNAYTSTKDLRRVAAKLGGPATMAPDLHRRPFRDPSPLAQRGVAQTVRIPYRTNVVTYRFDPATDSYLRSIDGKPHVDPADDQRVTTTNIVVLFQKFRIDTKIEPGHSRPDITTLGSGKAWIIQEGKLIKGTWRKKSDTAPTRFLDADGKEIPLVRGRTFIQVVPPSTKVTVKD
jgi:Protein of unknown function (DUF3048) N-terminal domain/Protein of unknown function (DUF3048) C-terminal domain